MTGAQAIAPGHRELPVGPGATEDRPAVVLDTNVVLDLLLFGDPSTQALQAALARGELRWLATPAMREELARVLAYPHLVAWAAGRGVAMAGVLEAFDARSRCVADAPPAAMRCSDPDDQKFIDLAVCHRAALWSKDHAVRRLRRALAAQGVVLY